jgi:hypothetical protein
MDHPSSVVDEAFGIGDVVPRDFVPRDGCPAEGALDRQGGNRRPVEATRYATEQGSIRRRRQRRGKQEAVDERA